VCVNSTLSLPRLLRFELIELSLLPFDLGLLRRLASVPTDSVEAPLPFL